MANLTQIKKRNGDIVDFSMDKIVNAINKAFINVTRSDNPGVANAIAEIVSRELELEAMGKDAYIPTVEHTQDLVEKHLMVAGFLDVAKHYIIYRYEHQKIREDIKAENLEKLEENKLKVVKKDGSKESFSELKLKKSLEYVVRGYENVVDVDGLVNQMKLEAFDGMTTREITKALIMVTRSKIEEDTAYSYVASRILLRQLYEEVIGEHVDFANLNKEYKDTFIKNIKYGLSAEQLDTRMGEFDLEKLSAALVPERDNDFLYLGTQTLYDRYLVRDASRDGKCIELLQGFWMRIAMGLALLEGDRKNEKAIEFYHAMSEMRFVPSSPTLFHSGTRHPQLSSCYLNSVGDSLESIYKVYGDNAQLSKYAGGIGTNWTSVRASGALVKATGIKSNGIIPFLKIADSSTVAINRSGRRRGAACVYLENWHYDFEEFVELRKNTGDERRRTHDMNTAAWISDLFMQRVHENGDWTLFSPDEVPLLTESYGAEFSKNYKQYEDDAKAGKIKLYKTMKATELWKKMITMLFETGHPWITFKDPSNIRSPQDHAGIVRNSNLCTEITLNNNLEETAVCNLGSFNYAKHINNGKYDTELVAKTIKTGMRMLDNVIDINYYPTKEAKVSNFRHRPVGLGVMGFHDALYMLNINFDTEDAVKFADESMEVISYHAILTSSELAREKGKYESYKGSKWDRGMLPQDTIKLLEESRGETIEVSKGGKLDWAHVRQHIADFGMRNSNCMAVAPTATISNITGAIPCIEPIYKNIFVKSNMNGDFITINSYLVDDLKRLGLWDYEMIGQIKFHDGSIKNIPGIPIELKEKYKEVFEIDGKWLIRSAAYRGKWIDQSQSLNIYFNGTSGRELAEVYSYAWKMGLKTTYYLRSLGASQVEKSTVNASEYGSTHKRGNNLNSSPEAPQVSIPTASTMAPVAVTTPDAKISEPVVVNKPITTPEGAVKKVYNITRAPEATCDGCQ